jgi:hypothetical protein
MRSCVTWYVRPDLFERVLAGRADAETQPQDIGLARAQ